MDTGSSVLFAAIANMLSSGSALSVTPGQPPVPAV